MRIVGQMSNSADLEFNITSHTHVGREPGNEATRVDILFVMLQHFLNEFYDSSLKFGYDSTYNLV